MRVRAAQRAADLPQLDRVRRSARAVRDHYQCHRASQLLAGAAPSVSNGDDVRWLPGSHQILS